MGVKTAISSTKSRSVDEYNQQNPNFDRLEYIHYNAEFKAGSEMDEKIRQGTVDRRVLGQLLHQRAFELMHRRAVLMSNEMSVTRAYKMDMLPLEVWNDFQAAKESLQKEVKMVQYLSHNLGVNFKKLMDTTIKMRMKSKDGSLLRSNLLKKKQALQNRRAPKKVQQAQRTKQQSSRGKASAKSSNKTEPNSVAGRAAAKGIRRRRRR